MLVYTSCDPHTSATESGKYKYFDTHAQENLSINLTSGGTEHSRTSSCEQNTPNIHYQTALLGPNASYLEKHSTHSNRRVVLNFCLGLSMQIVHSEVPTSFGS